MTQLWKNPVTSRGLLLVVAVAGFGGCGGGDSQSGSTSTPSTASNSTQPAASNTTTQPPPSTPTTTATQPAPSGGGAADVKAAFRAGEAAFLAGDFEKACSFNTEEYDRAALGVGADGCAKAESAIYAQLPASEKKPTHATLKATVNGDKATLDVVKRSKQGSTTVDQIDTYTFVRRDGGWKVSKLHSHIRSHSSSG